MKSVLIIIALFTSLTSCQDNSTWINLVDDEMSEWDNYLSYRHKAGYNGDPPQDNNGSLIPPIGINQDQYEVFKVIKENNETLIRVSGEIYGCLFTKKEYENYHFKLKMKWGDIKWHPRENLLKDSGILYHSIGELGVEHWRSWMLSQEFQIMEGHMGDYWSQANSAIDIRAFIPEYIMNPVADPGQPFLPLGIGEDIDGFCLRSNNYEKPHGEWNTLELICYEDKSIHIVNGEIVMILKNTRYLENGKYFPMTKGKIQLQSEAAELFFKDIQIRPIATLPERFLPYYENNQ